MKIHYVLFCFLLIAATSFTAFGESVIHTFTTTDGRTLNATIRDYNDRTGKIQIEREDGKKVWILPNVFSEADQEYVRQWIAVDQFMSPEKFKIEGEKTKNEISKNKTEVVYEITLENRTDHPLKDLRIEYRAFILNKGSGGNEDSNRLDGGEFQIAEIPDGEKLSQTTQPMYLVDNYSCSGKLGQEKLEGSWIKVHGPEVDGKPAIREWCNPPDASQQFTLYLEACETSNDEQELLDAVSGLWRLVPQKALKLALKAYNIRQSATAARHVGELYLFHLNPVNIPVGLEWMEKAAKKDDYTACWRLAEFYSTCTDPLHHDTKKGIEYGLLAVSLRSDDYLGDYYLAMAYAHDGQFEKAVEHQELVVNIHKKYCKISTDFLPYLSKMEETLELYRNNKTE